MQETAQIIRNLRIGKGITQMELASELRVSPSTVKKWEDGKKDPNPTQKQSLIQYFDAEPDACYISHNLHSYMLLNELSPEEFAEQLEISPDSLQLWIQGSESPSVAALPQLSKALEVPLHHLFSIWGYEFYKKSQGAGRRRKRRTSMPIVEKFALKTCADQISYIDANAPYCDIFFKDGRTQERIRASLTELESILGSDFLRCHDSYIVNCDQITGYARGKKKSYLQLTVDNHIIPIGGLYHDNVLKKLSKTPYDHQLEIKLRLPEISYIIYDKPACTVHFDTRQNKTKEIKMPLVDLVRYLNTSEIRRVNNTHAININKAEELEQYKGRWTVRMKPQYKAIAIGNKHLEYLKRIVEA